MAPISMENGTKPSVTRKPSHKKKTTYTIRLRNVIITPTMFTTCENVTLPISAVNGQSTKRPDGKLFKTVEFPRTYATQLVQNYNALTPHINERLARTIIEYYDKYTGQPVVQLYPEQVYVFDSYGTDYLKHLNHASRQDFMYQLKLRKRALKQMLHSLQH